MQAAEFNEWDFCPINLKPEEIKNPMLVFNDFFSDDWLPGQLARLKRWRDCVIGHGFYLDKNDSSFGLLHFHKLNICLVEAAYLLKEARCQLFLIEANEILLIEQDTWRDYPTNLVETELLNPKIVIDDFFNTYNLPQYREQLYEWLEYGLSAKASSEFIETFDLISIYENLQKLYSAAWLIHQRTSVKPYLKLVDAEIQTIPHPDGAQLYELDKKIQLDHKEMIGKSIAIIKHKLPSIQAVIYLGKSPENDQIFLLVFTSNDENRHAQSLSSMLEESCQSVTKVVTFIHHASNLFSGLANDHQFFKKALNCPVIYLSGDLMLPVIPRIEFATSEITPFNWERWNNQGKDFLSGAEYYLKIQAHSAALFSLHQCVECLLIAIIRGVLGYRVNNHNLSRLLKITEMFTGDLVEIFNLNDANNAGLFNLLKHAYINIRYKDTFEIDTKSLDILYQDTKKFLSVVEQVYRKYLMLNSL